MRYAVELVHAMMDYACAIFGIGTIWCCTLCLVASWTGPLTVSTLIVLGMVSGFLAITALIGCHTKQQMIESKMLVRVAHWLTTLVRWH